MSSFANFMGIIIPANGSVIQQLSPATTTGSFLCVCSLVTTNPSSLPATSIQFSTLSQFISGTLTKIGENISNMGSTAISITTSTDSFGYLNVKISSTLSVDSTATLACQYVYSS